MLKRVRQSPLIKTKLKRIEVFEENDSNTAMHDQGNPACKARA
nr:MAG TPA: hypothetical protein [Caudoviricetes sp.]